MKMTRAEALRSLIARIAAVFACAGAGCCSPSNTRRCVTVQPGYRGAGAWSRSTTRATAGGRWPPPTRCRRRRTRPTPDGAQASEVYQNVQVLGDLERRPSSPA